MFRNKLRLFAKDVLRVNDVNEYIEKHWNKKISENRYLKI